MSSEASEPAESSANPTTDTSLSSYSWKILAFGQGLSCLLATLWASQSTMFLNCDWNSPAFSCGWAYLLLSAHLIPLCFKGRQIRQATATANANTNTTASAPTYWFLKGIPLQTSPWTYFGMAILSFYGNYVSLSAIRFTTVTSISMFDAMAIPTAMILSHFFLGRRYVRFHLLGAFLCMVGLFLNAGVDLVSNHLYQEAVSDVQLKPLSNVTEQVKDDGSEEYPTKIVGDIMACAGGILFGANDVMAEFTVRRDGAGSTEYLGMIGLFGLFLSAAQAAITERQQIVALFHGTTNCGGNVMTGLLVLYILGQFSRKAGLAKFLTMSDAALLQLSLLTSDLYTAIFSIIYLQIFPRPFFWVSMLLVVSGIIVYELGKSPIVEDKQRIGKELDGVMVEGDLGAPGRTARSKMV